MFGTLGGPELFLIFVVALIVFGPRKLPEIGKSLGKMMAEFRKASNDFRNTIESEVEAEKIRDSMRIDLPKVDTVTPAAAAAAPGIETTAASGYPGGPDSPPAATEGGSAPEAVPESVHREPASTPIEPK